MGFGGWVRRLNSDLHGVWSFVALCIEFLSGQGEVALSIELCLLVSLLSRLLLLIKLCSFAAPSCLRDR